MKLPARWIDRPTPGNEAEDRVAGVLRRLDPAAALSAARLARIETRLAVPGRHFALAGHRWAIVVLLLLGSTGVVVAGKSIAVFLEWRRFTVEPLPVDGNAGARSSGRHGRRTAQGSLPVPTTSIMEPETPPPEITPSLPPAPIQILATTPAVRETRPARTPHAPDPGEPMPAVASPVPDPLAQETSLLAQALSALRRNGDAARALALLDGYRARFPRGSLVLEADGVRADALLALDRRAEALDLLNKLPMDEVGRGGELLVIRGELRAATNCRAAAADFDQVLARHPGAPYVERALYGRAGCRLRLGDKPGAGHDMQDYLARFPSGRFAGEVRKILRGY